MSLNKSITEPRYQITMKMFQVTQVDFRYATMLNPSSLQVFLLDRTGDNTLGCNHTKFFISDGHAGKTSCIRVLLNPKWKR
jgi:hypothetical protein